LISPTKSPKIACELTLERAIDPQGSSMTTVQITLPDELANKAASAGLLSADAMEAMLREQLRRRAGEALQTMWQRGPQEPLTPEIEQEIVDEVRKARTERRQRGAS
jgi:post-segregation antitoxin (ccd killing protein)